MSEILIFRGFSAEQIEKGRRNLAEKGESLDDLVFLPASKEMVDENVEVLLNRADATGQTELTDPIKGKKTVIMAVQSQERALQIMRLYKGLLDDPSEPAFAMVTPTSLSWSLGYYMDHVHKEHDYMKTHNPAEDPDMKKIN